MAWLFSCFRCNPRHRSGSSSPEREKAVENAVLMNASVLETQVVVQDERLHVNISPEKSVNASKQGIDMDRSLSSFFKTENRCYSPQKQSSHQPWQVVELQRHEKMKNLESEANQLQNSGGLLDSPDTFKKAGDELHGDSEEGKREGRHMAHLKSLLTKIECEGETLVERLVLPEQNKSDCNSAVDMCGPLLASTKTGVQLSDNEASEEMHTHSSSSSPATPESKASLKEEKSEMCCDKFSLERSRHDWRGCSSESKEKQLSSRRDDLSAFVYQDTDHPPVMLRVKRSSTALSFSELSLLEPVACSKFTSKLLGPEDFRRTESPVTRPNIGVNISTASRGEIDNEISKTLSANFSESLTTSGDGQAISFTVSHDATLYDTDMEVDSKAVKPYSNENHFTSHCSPHRWIQIPKYDTAHEVSLFSDLTMEQSQVFTSEDTYDGFSDALSQLSTECNSKKIMDERLDIDQMSHCSDATSFPTSPLPHVPSDTDKFSVKKRAQLHATARATEMLEENSAESSAECGGLKYHPELSVASTETSGRWVIQASHQSWSVDSFEETNSMQINLSRGMKQSSTNIPDLSSHDQLLPSNLLDEVTSKEDVTPCSRLFNVSSESCTCSSRDYGSAMSCKRFALLQTTSVSDPSPETLTYEKITQSPLPHNVGAKESTPHRIMLNLPPEVTSLGNLIQSVPELSNKSFLKHELTPRTPSASSSQVETPSSSQSTVSPADLAKDRPILGTVAAHWSHSSTNKWWDGKGIPNSTNKYKEDQKVSWHATPFEVRLERALAKQGRVFQKKLFGGAMATEMELRTEPITSSG